MFPNFPKLVLLGSSLLGCVFSLPMTNDEINRGINMKDLCEACDTSTGSGYSYHPNYCHLFVHCSLGAEGELLGQVKECTRGLLWSQKVKQCVWPMESDCSENPCVNQSVTIRDVRNCNGYFSCPDGSHLQYNCCPEDQHYEASTRHCVKDRACNDPCLPGSANVTAKTPDCSRYTVPDDPGSYLWSVDGQNITMTCATGTAFSPDFCSCTKVSGPIKDEPCEPYIHFPFDVNIKDSKGHTASGGNADIKRSDTSATGGGTAHFRGDQQVVAWAMNNMEFRSNFTLSFRFKSLLPDYQSADDERYALVDNSDCDKEATFGVALLRTSHKQGTVARRVPPKERHGLHRQLWGSATHRLA
ncbi:uncharacterized protein LOC112564972 isoform X2 [Pomacea canaliculata]|uniref:uncharacterized protein LOC112564972 isoform X2 n=1 Tax=Pomacea canaliculata TaxID=400727 RepID=UPI000D72778D|nr:uncharacterized protein LOC112564972 isoform X2 [Pomacea canaliculata]